MANAKVLKDFPLSNDGVKVVDVKKGDAVEVNDDLVEGLAAGGYIELVKTEAEKPAKAAKGAKE